MMNMTVTELMEYKIIHQPACRAFTSLILLFSGIDWLDVFINVKILLTCSQFNKNIRAIHPLLL